MEHNIGELSEYLTVIITTSPIRLNPDISMIRHTIGTMSKVPGLSQCKKIITCDGYRVSNGKIRSKAGKITREMAENYQGFLQRLRDEVNNRHDPVFENINLMIFDDRQGFGFSVMHALKSCTTRFALILQHDYPVMRQFDCLAAIQALCSPAGEHIKYAGLLSTSTIRPKMKVEAYRSKNIELPQNIEIDQFIFEPLYFWYDKPHIAEVKFYLKTVFNGAVTKGQFIEDTFGQEMLADCKVGGLEAHARYKAFVLNDGQKPPMVGHLNGRSITQGRSYQQFMRRIGDSRACTEFHNNLMTS